MTQHRWGLIFVALMLLGAVGLVSTNTAASRAAMPSEDVPLASTATPQVSRCLIGTQKFVDPTSIILGQSADVTLVVTHTCPALPLPIDMVIVADESFSMTKTKERIELPTEKATPDPSEVPPTKTPLGGEGVGKCDPPPFCGGSGSIEITPSPTPTKRWPPPPPPRQETPEPTAILENAGGEDDIAEVKTWVRGFMGDSAIVDDMGVGRLKVGFVSFNRRAMVRQNLSADPGDAIQSVNRIRGADITRITDAVREAERILNGQGARTSEPRIKVVMLISDFEFCPTDVRKMASDIVFISVGIGVRQCDADKMSRMATSREYVFNDAKPNQVVKKYRDNLVTGGRALSVADLLVRDELTSFMELNAASLQPPTATVRGGLIEWPVPLPPSPITFTYSIKPSVDGDQQLVSAMAEAHFTDTVGLKGMAPFPEVRVDVIAYTPTPTLTATPTKTPTATPTDTPTATPTPGARYLPVVRKNWPPPIPTNTPPPTPTVCVPELQTIDVALVMDSSTSMNQPTHAGGPRKLDAAIEAGQTLVSLLKAGDQTAVVGFNAGATLLLGLSTDKAAAHGALANVPQTQASGTNLYAALLSSYQELEGPRHMSTNNRSIVLLTDGQHNDPLKSVDDVRALADEIKAAGIDIVTVGLGSDVDAALLQQIASTPAYYFPAPDASELADIYTQIAHLIPCP